MSSPFTLFPGRTADKEQAHELALVLDAQRTQMHRINALLDEVSTATAELDRVRSEFQNFRTSVRDLAIEKREEMNFCIPGLNAALEELGLDPFTRTFRVPVTVTATREIYVDVEAADEDAAREEVEEDWELAWQEIDWSERHGWNHSDQDVANSYSVEEVRD